MKVECGTLYQATPPRSLPCKRIKIRLEKQYKQWTSTNPQRETKIEPCARDESACGNFLNKNLYNTSVFFTCIFYKILNDAGNGSKMGSYPAPPPPFAERSMGDKGPLKKYREYYIRYWNRVWASFLLLFLLVTIKPAEKLRRKIITDDDIHR